jgi:hypothetical protein
LEAPGCELEARSEVTGEARVEARFGFEVLYTADMAVTISGVQVIV